MTAPKQCPKTMPISRDKELRCILTEGHAGVHKSKGWTFIKPPSRSGNASVSKTEAEGSIPSGGAS